MTCITCKTRNRHTLHHDQRENPALEPARQNRYTNPLHTASAGRRRSEALVRRHGAADQLGEGRPLIWRGQLLDRQRGVEAADEVLEVEFVCVVDAGLGHVEPGCGQGVAVKPLARLVGAAGAGGLGVEPFFLIVS